MGIPRALTQTEGVAGATNCAPGGALHLARLVQFGPALCAVSSASWFQPHIPS